MLKFRNLTVSPDDPVDVWGVEGLLTAIERGTAPDWAKITRAVRLAGPASELRKELEEALDLADGGGVPVLRLALRQMDASPEERVMRNVRQLFAMSEMTVTEFAERVGASRTRMSSYIAGRTMPLASALEKMETVAQARRDEVQFS